jgi:uncharacterized membrane protein YphA (DoxX/SURF4 family)
MIGRRVYGLGAIVLGIPGLIHGQFAAMGLPVAGHVPEALVYACAGLLILGGLAINLPGTERVGALGLAGFFGLWMLGLHLPHALARPAEWVSWEAVAENSVMALGGVFAYLQLAVPGETRAVGLGRFARPAFGLGLVVFGVSEFVYAKFTASMVPAWLPPSPLAWTYITGAAQIAAGLAIMSGVRARTAAVLLTGMYLGFSLLVHLPRLIASPASLGALGENGVNLVLAGAVWRLADWLGKAKASG